MANMQTKLNVKKKYYTNELDDSDEERELTNLNWLVGNQSISWSTTIDLSLNNNLNFIETARKKEETIIWDNSKIVLDEKKMIYSKESIPTKKTKISKSKSVSDFKVAKSSTSRRVTPDERYEIFLKKIKCDLAEYEKLASKYETDVTRKPPFNYSNIIGMAMLKNGRVTLQQLCAWIESKFAFYRVRKRWNNSIRHNLSLHHCFRNQKREEKGKGGYWELGLDPKKSDKKRIRNRKLRHDKLHNALESKTKCFPVQKFEKINKSNNNTISSKPSVSSKQSSVLIDPMPSLTKMPTNENTLVNKDRLEINSFNAGSRKEIYEKDHILDAVPIGSAEILDARQSFHNLSYHDSDRNQQIAAPNFLLPSGGTGYDDTIPVLSSSTHISLDESIQAGISSSGNVKTNYDSENLDGIDERFHCLHASIQYSRGDDILDNFLDVCPLHY
ncbi:meiosis-specific transcription factor mei4 [Drosophila ananassae]|uniref:meiosis-specific transcription factor mei4 n=1 Tax=Drosophila ananassae TaxID=7217 RepID=UPI0013A5E22C|nr:meiosis-specific transcription factor mei4 [Drosophila ananassae]